MDKKEYKYLLLERISKGNNQFKIEKVKLSDDHPVIQILNRLKR